MPKRKTKLIPKVRQRVATMLELHARAFHLPHVERYHVARRKNAKSYDKENPEFGNLRKNWELPVYLLDLNAQGPLELTTAARNGWVEFLDWNGLLPAIAEIRSDRKVVSVATGAAAKRQCHIVERILAHQGKKTKPSVASLPALHFRALVYERKSDGKQQVVPLSSPVVPVKLGASYSREHIVSRLRSAMALRLTAAEIGPKILG